ncbi:MAG: N-acetyl-gamma-glutamyl-phosphate reductase [Myxococcales bacterium]|nr:N-acetyl-gamma-glutamyl-phosphate reductase [Myxococcales bacterium]
MAEVVVFGAGGYSGQELLRWLSWHPDVRVVLASSDTLAGVLVRDVVPAVGGASQLRFTSHVETLASTSTEQFALLAVPAKTAAELVPSLLERGLRVIDLSGAHRLPAPMFPQWYGFEHPFPSSLEHAVYGLPELVEEERIAKAVLVANPGCYATAAALAAAPLVKAHLYAPGSPLIVDGKSGATGAGRALSTPMLFSELADDVRPYKVGCHQHTPEMEHMLGTLREEPVKVLFTAHLVPLRRGLLCSVYGTASETATVEKVSEVYTSLYEDASFVSVRDGCPPETKRTMGLAQAEVWASFDPRTRVIAAFGGIDNLIKGAAGQAIQNLNLMLGLDMRTGLQPAAK